jgi:hypothetical protein
VGLGAVLGLFLLQPCSIAVEVRDGAGAEIPDASVSIGDRAGSPAREVECGRSVTVTASAPGYDTVSRQVKPIAGVTEVEIALPLRLNTSITVTGETASERGGAGAAVSMDPAQIKQLPTDPPAVKDALPLVPGVVRTPEGKLQISGVAEHRSTLLVNSIDVTDPATGKFGATIPIDAVAVLSVYKSPFLAEYGRFSAGVVSVDTRRGGDRWRYELNDPTPELRIRSRHLRGVRAYTPRLSGSGPLAPGRLYVSESMEYALRKTPVFTLPFPRNEEKSESWNSFTQFDYVASARRLVTVTLHAVPERRNFAGLSFYTAQPSAASFRGHEYRASVADRVSLGGGVLESAFSGGQVFARTGAQGEDEFTFTPTMNTGSYFLRQDRRAERAQWLETYSRAPLRGHHLKVGGSLARTRARGAYEARPVNVRGPAGEWLRRTEFDSAGPYRVTEWESSLYAHDRWVATPSFSIDAGLRGDWQEQSGGARVAPRAGAAWSPFGDSGTVLRGGFGMFFDRIPLNVHAFRWYPAERGRTNVAAGDFAPRTRTWSAQVDRRVHRILLVRAGYLDSRSSGLPVLEPGMAKLTLRGAGRAHYRQLEAIARLSWQEGQELFFSYMRSRSRGNLNDFAMFLGDIPAPLLRRDAYATSPGDIPQRFLAWGIVPLAKGWKIAPVIEHRAGFPYSALDAGQQYVGVPNGRRFPNFFSLDVRVAKDIHYRGHGFQVSFSMFNVTNHWNPDSVRLNVADPQFGEFLGQHRRRYRVDFDFLF